MLRCADEHPTPQLSTVMFILAWAVLHGPQDRAEDAGRTLARVVLEADEQTQREEQQCTA